MTDAENDDETNTSDDEDQQLSWEQARSAGMKMRDATKEYRLEILDQEGDVDGVLVFEYRQLSPKDKERIQDKGVNTQTRGGRSDVEVKSRVITRETLKRGVESGPEGFTTTNQGVTEFMNAFPDHSEALADHINDFSEMEPTVTQRFRQVE